MTRIETPPATGEFLLLSGYDLEQLLSYHCEERFSATKQSPSQPTTFADYHGDCFANCARNDGG
jgi:hypothetical protein